MKYFIILIALTSLDANAHCPFSYKPEKVCFMLDQNILYVWDQKNEHNGPYKDLEKSTIVSMKNQNKNVVFSKIARGVYKIANDDFLSGIDIEVKNSNKIIIIKVEKDKQH